MVVKAPDSNRFHRSDFAVGDTSSSATAAVALNAVFREFSCASEHRLGLNEMQAQSAQQRDVTNVRLCPMPVTPHCPLLGGWTLYHSRSR